MIDNSASRSALKDIDFRHLWHPFTQHKVWFEENDPLIIERGEGVRLIDVDGREYLDGVSSLWCNVHGHSVPELTRVLHEQVDTLCHSTLLGLSHTPVLELTRRLMAVTPSHLTRAFYSDSGSAAVEAALRMAIEWWQKQGGEKGKKKTKLVSLASGYHGDTLGSVGLGYLRDFHQHLNPVIVPSLKLDPPHVYRFRRGFSEDDALEESVASVRQLFEREADRIAAFVLEPLVQGAAGMWIQPVEYGIEISRLCRAHDVLLIADEVATGFGKTGKLFAVEHGAIVPDILVLGKGLSGGYAPISAALATEAIFEGFLGEPEELRTFFFGQTFSGNPLAARVSLANLELFASNALMEQVQGRISHFREKLQERLAPLSHVAEVRSLGVMTGIELTKEPGTWVPYPANSLAGVRVTREARKRGAVIRPLGNVVVLMPPLAMEEEDLTRLVDSTSDAIVGALGE